MKKRLNSTFCSLFFSIVLLIEVYCFMKMSDDLISLIGCSVVLLISVYLLVDSIKGDIQERDQKNREELKKLFDETLHKDINDKGAVNNADIDKAVKANYVATKKLELAVNERIAKMEEIHNASINEILAGFKNSAKLIAKYNREDSKQIAVNNRKDILELANKITSNTEELLEKLSSFEINTNNQNDNLNDTLNKLASGFAQSVQDIVQENRVIVEKPVTETEESVEAIEDSVTEIEDSAIEDSVIEFEEPMKEIEESVTGVEETATEFEELVGTIEESEEVPVQEDIISAITPDLDSVSIDNSKELIKDSENVQYAEEADKIEVTDSYDPNKAMSPDDIEALLDSMGQNEAIEEPEEPDDIMDLLDSMGAAESVEEATEEATQDAQPVKVQKEEPYDPNKAMSPDDIAALLDSMGTGVSKEEIIEEEKQEPIIEQIPEEEPDPVIVEKEEAYDPNKAMSPDDIAALLDSMGTGEPKKETTEEPKKVIKKPEAEPVKEKEPLDPNKPMSPDDIAALLASMGEEKTEEKAEEKMPEPVKVEEPYDPNKAMSPDDIAALLASMGK